MSHVRPKKIVTSACHCCDRPDWTREERYSLMTQAEHDISLSQFTLEVPGMPKQYEPMYVSAGATIHYAVKEAIEYLRAYPDIPGAGFEFNDKTVVVTKHSDAGRTVDEWWKASYNETQAESMARR